MWPEIGSPFRQPEQELKRLCAVQLVLFDAGTSRAVTVQVEAAVQS